MNEKSIEQRLKEVIIRRLSLKIKPEEIQNAAPLFIDGLGLDSVDALEIIVGIEEEFGIMAEDIGVDEFFSIDTLATYLRKKIGEAGESTS